MDSTFPSLLTLPTNKASGRPSHAAVDPTLNPQSQSNLDPLHFMALSDQFNKNFDADETVSRLQGLSLNKADPSIHQDGNDSLFENSIETQRTLPADPEEKTDASFAESQLTLRALVSSKEAGTIIGKAGKNVAELRDTTGVKAGVSKVVPGVHDRVLTITGALDAVVQAYTLIAQTFLENPVSNHNDSNANPSQTTIRLLVSHNLMGTIIGRQGLKIKHIQDVSNARMVASKEMLPQSTERVVEVQGEVNSIQKALWEIGKCLVEDWERGVGTVLYNPAVRLSPSSTVTASTQSNGIVPASGTPGNYLRNRQTSRTGNASVDFSAGPEVSSNGSSDYKVQNISIPADMVGCIIGKAGSKITEIRRNSGSKIAIAKDVNEHNE